MDHMSFDCIAGHCRGIPDIASDHSLEGRMTPDYCHRPVRRGRMRSGGVAVPVVSSVGKQSG